MAASLLTACMREAKRILSDSRIFVLLIGGPFLYAFVFGGVYWQGRSQHVPIIIVDQDHSALSRGIVNALRASENVQIAGWANSPDELPELARREVAYACVMFPANLERDMLAGRAPKVAILLDGTNTLLAAPALGAVRSVVASYQIGISSKVLKASGVPPGSATTATRSISLVGRPLFNPTGHYGYFMLIGLVCAATQSVIRMAVGVSIGFDRYDRMCQELKPADLSTAWLYASKVLGTCAVTLPAVYGAVASVLTLFGTPHRGSLLLVWLAVTMYVVLQVCMGYGYFGLCKSPLFALHVHMFMASVLFIVSGFSWPYYAMPAALQVVAHVLPIFHMNCIMREVNLVGVGVGSVLPHLLSLCVFLGLAYAWGYSAFKKWVVSQKATSPEFPQSIDC